MQYTLLYIKVKSFEFLILSKGKEFENPLLPQQNIEIDGRSFPAGIVINWSDIKIRREIGEGNFGKVYQGYLQMNEVQR